MKSNCKYFSLCLSSEINCGEQKKKRHANPGQLYQSKKIKNLKGCSDKNAALNAWEEVIRYYWRL